MVIGREARGLGARAAFPSGEVFRDPGFSGATAALHRSGPSSSVWRGSLRTSRQLRKRKAACAQLQLVSTDGENFRAPNELHRAQQKYQAPSGLPITFIHSMAKKSISWMDNNDGVKTASSTAAK